MFRLYRIAILALIVVLFSLQTTLAQSDAVMQLGGYLDQRASSSGLPTGDGLVSPVEQSLASALIDEITGFNQSVTEFEQASPANAGWLDTVEQRTTGYNQQMADAGTNAPVDVRAEMISNAVAQYGQDVDAASARGSYDVRAQIISDAVAQYGRDTSTLQAQAPTDPRAEAIANAVTQYGQQMDALQAQSVPDPRAEAIANAVAQYGQQVSSNQSPSPATSQAISSTIRGAARDSINRSGIKRKIIVIQHIDEMIETEFDRSSTDQLELLPGFWRQTKSSMVMSGTCKSAAMGMGKGDGTGGDSPTPVAPLTPICQSTAGDFLFIDDRPYGQLAPLLYGQSSSERQLVLQNFQASGSINTTTSVEYQIAASDLIDIRKTYQEDGGCTITYESTYQLVQTDPSVCLANENYVETPEPAPTLMSTPVPGATVPPEPTQPIPSGSYPITWTVDSGTCTEKTQSTFTEAQIDYTGNGDMLLRLGEDEHTLFAIGTQDSPRYQFLSSQWQIMVQKFDDGTIKLDWGKMAGMEMCFKGGELGASAGPVVTPPPAANPTATPVVVSGGQHYQVKFKPNAQTCPQAVLDKLPVFDGATFEALPGGGYQLIAGGQTLSFTDKFGMTVYDGSDVNKGLTYQISLMSANPQGGTLSIAYISATGEMCLGDMALTAG